jgi:hypothetical protein
MRVTLSQREIQIDFLKVPALCLSWLCAHVSVSAVLLA